MLAHGPVVVTAAALGGSWISWRSLVQARGQRPQARGQKRRMAVGKWRMGDRTEEGSAATSDIRHPPSGSPPCGVDKPSKQVARVRVGALEDLGVPLHTDHPVAVRRLDRFDQTIR